MQQTQSRYGKHVDTDRAVDQPPVFTTRYSPRRAVKHNLATARQAVKYQSKNHNWR